MHQVGGGCHCGNVRVELELARAPGTYQPRVCDCDFCRKHSAAYVSDAHGILRIRVQNARDCGEYRQGSSQAEFLLCRNCGILIGILYRDGGRIYGAVNARTIDAGTDFGPEQPVSPRKLSADDKAKRWQNIWFSTVTLVNVSPAAP